MDNWLQTKRHDPLSNWKVFLARVTTADQHSVLDPAIGRSQISRPHPASVLLFAKTIFGSTKHVLDAFRETEPEAMGRAGLARIEWMRIPRGSTEARVLYLLRLADQRAAAIPARGILEFEEIFGAEVGLGYAAIRHYKAIAPELLHKLESLRPDLYGSKSTTGKN
jgi:hypothetical protein